MTLWYWPVTGRQLELLYGTNKAFLRLRGKPLLSYVISALDRASEIRSIHIAGPANKLRELLSEFKYDKPVSYIEQGETVFKNLWYGALHTYPEYERGKDYRELRNSPEAAKYVLAITSDTPLLEPSEVNHFIKDAPMDKFDFVFGITRKEVLLPFAPKGNDPGINFAYFVMKDIIFRQANFFQFRPLKLGYVMDDFIPLIYSIRYQKELSNIIKAMSAIIKAGAGLKALYYFILLQVGRSSDMKGRKWLRDFVRKGITLPKIPRIRRTHPPDPLRSL